MEEDIVLTEECMLIYIYNATSPDREIIPPGLDRDSLLLPPLLTYGFGLWWERLVTIANRPLTERDVLPTHCFHDTLLDRYYDDNHQELPQKIEPCGDSVIREYKSIDALISNALGIPPASGEETNLKELSNERSEPEPGDIFALQIREGEYMFGRVIRTDAVTRCINLRILKPSRKWIRLGDIFVMQPFGGEYVFGRVIRTDATMGDFISRGIVIYVYNAPSQDKEKIPPLDKDDLLVPPMIIDRGPWSLGIFETIAQQPLEQNDILPQHCFAVGPQQKTFKDEYGRILRQKTQPCGSYSLTLEGGVDAVVSRALGLPPLELP